MGHASPTPRAGVVHNRGVDEQWVGEVLLDRYRIVDQIDAGGVAAVFRAEQTDLGREVAVKILAENVESAPRMAARFEREARALAALSHPHTVPLLDFGVAKGRPFLVMELLRGRSLEAALAKESFDFERSVAIVRQVLHSLAFAHGQGVVHRDIKPGNVFLEQLPHTDDHVRVLDFGFAKFFAANDERQGSLETMAGTTFGTPGYVAPEQLGENEVDGRADLYAVGVILFQMLAGVRPFDGTPPEMLRGKLTREAPLLSEARDDLKVVPALDELLRKVLRRDPEERFATAQQLLDALDQLPAKAVSGSAAMAPTLLEVEATREVTVGMLVDGDEAAGAAEGRAKLAATHEMPRGTADGPEPASVGPVTGWSLLSGMPKWVFYAGPALALGLIVLGVTALLGGTAASSPRVEKTIEPEPPVFHEPVLWAGELPEPLASAHARLMDGESLERDELLELRRYGDHHPESPHAWLLIGHAYAERHWYSDALESYERAHGADPSVRDDPFLANNLVSMLTRTAVSARALRLARALYEDELGGLIDARLADESLRAAQVQQLERVRDRLDR